MATSALPPLDPAVPTLKLGIHSPVSKSTPLEGEVARLEQYLAELQVREGQARQREEALSGLMTEAEEMHLENIKNAEKATAQRMAELAQTERAAAIRVRELEDLWEKGQGVMLSTAEEVSLNQALVKLRRELQSLKNEKQDAEELCILVKNELTQAQRAQDALHGDLIKRRDNLVAEASQATATLAQAEAELTALSQQFADVHRTGQEAAARLTETQTACKKELALHDTLAADNATISTQLKESQEALLSLRNETLASHAETSAANAALEEIRLACKQEQVMRENHASETHRAAAALQVTRAALAELEERTAGLEARERAVAAQLAEVNISRSDQLARQAQLEQEIQVGTANLLSIREAIAADQAQLKNFHAATAQAEAVFLQLREACAAEQTLKESRLAETRDATAALNAVQNGILAAEATLEETRQRSADLENREREVAEQLAAVHLSHAQQQERQRKLEAEIEQCAADLTRKQEAVAAGQAEILRTHEAAIAMEASLHQLREACAAEQTLKETRLAETREATSALNAVQTGIQAAEATLLETRQRAADLENREREVADQLAIVNLSHSEQQARQQKLEAEIQQCATELVRQQEVVAAGQQEILRTQESAAAVEATLAELRQACAAEQTLKETRLAETREAAYALNVVQAGISAAESTLTETRQRTADLETREREVADQLAIVNLSHTEQQARQQKLEAEIEKRSADLAQSLETAAAAEASLTQLREACAAEQALKESRLAETRSVTSALNTAQAGLQTAEATLAETRQRTADLENREREVAEQLAIVNLSQAEQMARKEKLEGEIELATSSLTRTQEEVAAMRRHAVELREAGEAAAARVEELQALVKVHGEEEAATRLTMEKNHAEFITLDEELRTARRNLLDINNPVPAMQDLTNSGVAYESMQQVVREVIKIVDFTDMAHAFVKTNDESSVSGEQFMLLRQSLVGLLNNLDVEEVVVDPGTPVDRAMRSRIQVARHMEGATTGTTCIQSMLSPGYARLNASGKQVFLRKPEVVTTSAEILPA